MAPADPGSPPVARAPLLDDEVAYREALELRSGSGELARKVFLFLGMALVCAAAGMMLVFFPPAFLIGAVFGLAAVTAILVNPFVGLVLYAALFLLRPAEIYPVLGALRLERVVGMVVLGSMFLGMFRREGKLFVDFSRQTHFLVFLLVAFGLSVPGSYWSGASVERIVDLLKLIAFYLMIVHLITTRTRLRVFVWSYFVLIAYIGVTSLKAYFAGNLIFAQGIERVAGITSAGGDPNSLGATLGSTIPIALFLAMVVRPGWPKALTIASIAAMLATIALTGSRSTMLGLLASAVVLWWMTGRRVTVAILGVLILAAGFTALPEQYKQRYQSIGSEELDQSSAIRIATWKAGSRMLLDRPLTGVGVGAFGPAHATRYSPGNWLESHSLYVQVMAETGLIGVIAFFGFLITALALNRRAARRIKAARPDWGYEVAMLDGIFAGILFLLVFSVFGHTLLRFTWYIYAALGLAIYRLHLDLPADDVPAPPATAAGSR